MAFIPHTPSEIENMLKTLELDSLAALFAEIPESLLHRGELAVPERVNECQLTQEMAKRATLLQNGACYLGGGAYQHHIPAAVWQLATRGEFMTAYTPYQAEASQGALQVLFEYQTMMTRLLGMEVANASLYDGATSLAEAVLMAARLLKQQSATVLVPKTLSPWYREALESLVQQDSVSITTVDFDSERGTLTRDCLTPYDDCKQPVLILPQPNFFGQLEDVDTLTEWAHSRQGYVIAVVNPLAMAILKEPGQWGKRGADIACGEGQPLGIPLAAGGPYCGFFTTRRDFIRQIPGRLVGQTQDESSTARYCLTLQTREQHIRRAKATSNICTNQGLMVTATTIYLALLGTTGLQRTAQLALHNTVTLAHKITGIRGFRKRFSGPHFHEVVLQSPVPVAPLLERMAEQGIFAGIALKPWYPEFENCFTVCVTETKNETDLARYVSALQACL